MALSLGALHDALNDFVLKSFGGDSSLLFRFDKYGSVIGDADFRPPQDPAGPVLPALARERFSDLVNRIPRVCDDGLNVVLSADSVDDTYFFRLLSPSQGADAALKAEAIQRWNNQTLESLDGTMLQFKPSDASPAAWYDESSDVWTSHSFTVTAAQHDPPATDPGLWRLRVDPGVLRRIAIPLPVQPVQPEPVEPVEQPMRRFRAAPVLSRLAVRDRPIVHADLLSQVRDLSVRDRLVVSQAIAEQAPTQPVTTPALTVSFSYCLVHIDRPWWVDAFVNSATWSVPGLAVGALSDAAAPGGMAHLTVAVLVVKDLTITGSWTGEDATAAAEADGLGPFKVEPGLSATGSLTHTGLQTVGWLLQPLPALPPLAS
jgi:hypothetical protein